MPGTRYTDWTHIRTPDRATAAPYVGEGRKLLGYVWEDAARAGLGYHKLQRRLDDGTVITAEKIGEIPRITIEPVPVGTVRYPATIKDRFVVWARDTAHPDGIDALHPQQILKAKPQWQTFFYDGDIVGYDSFGRGKGLYRWGSNDDELFPDGVRHAGNVDWLSKDGARLSWYGPSARLFTDPYVQMTAQYGKFVFLLGQVLLNVDQYVIDTGATLDLRHVRGACLRSSGGRLWLYVLLAQHVDVSTPPSMPGEGNYATGPLLIGNVSMGLVRFPLLEDPMQPGVMKHRVDTGTAAEVLWSGALDNHQPFFFNESGTAAVSSSTVGSGWYCQRTHPDTSWTVAPGTQCTHYRLDIGETSASLSTETSTLAPSLGSRALLAREFRGDALVSAYAERVHFMEDDRRFALVIDDAVLPIYGGNEFVGATYDTTHRWFMYVNLRDRVCISRKDEVHVTEGPPSVRTVSTLEIRRAGAMVSSVPLLDETTGHYSAPLPTSPAPLTSFENIISTTPLDPMFLLYGMVSDSQSFPAIRWFGRHAGLHCLPYPPPAMYGLIQTKKTSGGSEYPRRLADLATGTFEGNRIDFDGNYSVLGCATQDDVTVLSVYGHSGVYSPDPGAPSEAPAVLASASGHSVHWVDGDSLPSLTAIGGENARYHPIWLLGNALPANPTP